MILKIPIDIFNAVVYVYEGEDSPEFEKHYCNLVGRNDKNKKYLSLVQYTEAITLNHKCGISFVRLPDSPKTGTVAHEFLHSCNYILTNRGFKLDESSEEVWNYLLGYLIDKYTKLKVKHIAKLNKENRSENN